MLSATGLYIGDDGILRSPDIKGEKGELFLTGKEGEAAVKWASDLLLIREIIRKEITDLASQG